MYFWGAMPVYTLTFFLEFIIIKYKGMNNNTNDSLGNIQVLPHQYRTVSRIFAMRNSLISHENRIEVETSPTTVNQVKVTNYPLVNTANNCLKVTQIQIGDKIIKFIDEFCFNQSQRPQTLRGPSSSQQSTSRSPSHQPIIKRSSKVNSDSDQETFKYRDLKNVVKNIIKLFHNWISGSPLTETSAALKQTLKLFLENNKKFNNGMVIRLSKEPSLSQAFKVFCEEHGQEMITHSRIRDKESHFEALQRYQQMCCNVDENQQVGTDSSNVKIEDEGAEYLYN